MSETRSSQAQIDSFLERLSRELGELPQAEVREIVMELRAHIGERLSETPATGEEVAEVLRRLGTPHGLAAMYLAEAVAARAASARSGVELLRHLSRWARLSLVGAAVLAGVVLGYVIGVSIIISAIMKPFSPGAGLWLQTDGSLSLHLGLTRVPIAGRELLGWWIIPLGLTFGVAMFIFTATLGRFAAGYLRQTRSRRRGREAPPT